MQPQPVPLNVEKFLSKYGKTIYIKIERMNTPDILKSIFETVEEMNNIGFVVKADMPRGLRTPKNLLKIDYIPTADMLGQKKIVGFMHDGDWASIVEGVYFSKPMLVLSDDYDKRANGAFVEHRMIGVSIGYSKEITTSNLIQKMKIVLNPDVEMTRNIQKYSQLLIGIDTKKLIEKTFDNYIKNEIEHLVVKPFYEMPFYSYYNIDVWVTLFGIPALVIYGIWTCFKYLFKKLVMIMNKKVEKSGQKEKID